MQHAAHPAAQRTVDHLMLLDLGLAGEGRRNNRSRVVVSVAGQVLDLDLGAGDAVHTVQLAHDAAHGVDLDPLGAGMAAQIGMVGPLSTILMGVWILGEPFTPWVAAGTVLVMAGIFIFTRMARRP